MSVIEKLGDLIILPLISLIVGLGILLFFWGLVMFIAQPANEEARKTGLRHMLWGIIGIFLMVSVTGIVRLIVNTLEIDDPRSRINNTRR